MTDDDRRARGAPARYADYPTVAGLPTPDLERLLREGDAPERVWAAWSLGLRDAAGALPHLTAAATQSPDAGVRASLIVILAGHGRRDVLAALVEGDPDPDVRAAACRHLAGTSIPGEDWAWELLGRRLATDDAPAVLAVLLDLAADGRVTIGDQRRAQLLTRPEERVRHPAAEHAIAAWRDGSPMPAGFAELLDEADVALRERAADLLADRLGAGGVARLLAVWPATGRVAAWQPKRLARRGLRAGWDDLGAVAAVEGAEDGVVAALAEDDVAARPWLLSVAARQESAAWPEALERAVRLAIASTSLGDAELDDARQVRSTLARWIEVEEEDPSLDWPDESSAWVESQRAALAALDVVIRSGSNESPGASNR